MTLREEFEEWAKTEKLRLRRSPTNQNNYYFRDTQSAWAAYQACAARRGEPGPIRLLLDGLSDQQRLEIFAEFCVGCGSKDKRCQCWNDE